MFGKKKPSKYRDKYVNNKPSGTAQRSGSSSSARSSSSNSSSGSSSSARSSGGVYRGSGGVYRSPGSTGTRRRPDDSTARTQTAQKKPSTQKKPVRKKKKKNPIKVFFGTLFRMLLIILVIVCVAGGFTLYKVKGLFDAVNTTPMDETQLVTVDNDSNMSGYTNIALFGVDTRGLELSSDEATRSDSIIIVTINNKTHDVKMTSVYRDTYCSINGKYSKITHAYAYGGPELAVSTLNRNFDLNISQYATVNFKIMADIIDALGGLELTVEEDFIDDLNKYIKETNKITGGDSATFDSAGTYTLDGNQAVAYSRIRHNQNGDFSRASRQRIVLKALATKMKSHPIKSLKALQDVMPQVQTNMTSSDLMKLAMFAPFYNFDTNDGIPYKDDMVEGRINGMCVNIPSTLEETVVKLHKDLFGTDDYQISDELTKINQKIMAQSGYYN